jgi:hypothetical protein
MPCVSGVGLGVRGLRAVGAEARKDINEQLQEQVFELIEAHLFR